MTSDCFADVERRGCCAGPTQTRLHTNLEHGGDATKPAVDSAARPAGQRGGQGGSEAGGGQGARCGAFHPSPASWTHAQGARGELICAQSSLF